MSELNVKMIAQAYLSVLYDLKENSKEISKKAKAFATDGEMKQEGKYDTRAIEAGYLAGAQEKRFLELQRDYNALNDKIRNSMGEFSKSIGAYSYCQVNKQHYFIVPMGGGHKFDVHGVKIQVISLSSPLGEELIGLEEGDSGEFEINNNELLIKKVQRL